MVAGPDGQPRRRAARTGDTSRKPLHLKAFHPVLRSTDLRRADPDGFTRGGDRRAALRRGGARLQIRRHRRLRAPRAHRRSRAIRPTGSTPSASTAPTTTTRSGPPASSSGSTPVTHSSQQQHKSTRSITNYSFNHIGGLASNHYELCKSLVMGGVFTRFPELRIGFLEGGVAWAVSLLADMIGHWDKRNANAIGSLDPAQLDVDALMRTLAGVRGTGRARTGSPASARTSPAPPAGPASWTTSRRRAFTSADEIIDLFSDRMFFGCEADDPLVGWAVRHHHQAPPGQPSPHPRHRHLALGRTGDERGDRRGIRAAGRQCHRRG